METHETEPAVDPAQQAWERQVRFRRAKRMLRPLPRRANLHRWPILKWFAKTARKTPHLWRFGEREVRLSIYIGSIIAFLPIFGVQFVVAFFLALAVRSNLLVIMGVQLVTNFVTAVPIYFFTQKFGSWLVSIWGLPELNNVVARKTHEFMVGGIITGLLFGFVVDLLYRFIILRRLQPKVNVKQVIKNKRS